MKLDQLTYFIETAKSQHLGRAAQILSISPSAVSHSISSLEEELGIKLFEKNGKNIILTEKGKLFLERAEPILNDLNHLKHEISHEALDFKGFFKIAGGHQLSPQIVAPACFELQETHPELQFEIQTFRSAFVLNEVLNRQIDLGICYSPQEHPDLSSKELLSGTLQVVVRRNHPILKKRTQDRVAALNSLPCIMAKPSQGIQVCETHPVFKKHGIGLNVTSVCDNYEVALAKIMNSEAWAFLPEWAIKEYRSDVSIVTVSSNWNASYNISAIWHRKQPLSPALEELLERIEEKLTH